MQACWAMAGNLCSHVWGQQAAPASSTPASLRGIQASCETAPPSATSPHPAHLLLAGLHLLAGRVGPLDLPHPLLLHRVTKGAAILSSAAAGTCSSSGRLHPPSPAPGVRQGSTPSATPSHHCAPAKGAAPLNPLQPLGARLKHGQRGQLGLDNPERGGGIRSVCAQLGGAARPLRHSLQHRHRLRVTQQAPPGDMQLAPAGVGGCAP